MLNLKQKVEQKKNLQGARRQKSIETLSKKLFFQKDAQSKDQNMQKLISASSRQEAQEHKLRE